MSDADWLKVLDLVWATSEAEGRGAAGLSTESCTLVLRVNGEDRAQTLPLGELSLELAGLMGLGPRPVRGTWDLGTGPDLSQLLTEDRSLRSAAIQLIARGLPAAAAGGLTEGSYACWGFMGQVGTGQPPLLVLNTPQAIVALNPSSGGRVEAVADPRYVWQRLNALIVTSVAQLPDPVATP